MIKRAFSILECDFCKQRVIPHIYCIKSLDNNFGRRLVWNVYIFDPRLLWDNRTFPQHINYVTKINSNSCLRLMYYSCGCTKSFLKIVSLKTTTKGNLEIKTKNRCSSNWEWAYLIWPFCSENANFALLTLLPVFIAKRNNWLIFQF